MLSRDDRALVERERELPGLRVLLDPDLLGELLSASLGSSSLDRVQLGYLRYKPRTSCLAGYRVWVDGRAVDAYAKAFRLGEASKLAKSDAKLVVSELGPGRLVFDELALSIHFHPNDRKLRSLRRLSSPESRSRMLAKAVDQPELLSAKLVRLAYKPERRFVGLLRTGDGPAAVVKLHSRRRLGEPPAHAAVDAGLSVLRIPRWMGGSLRHGMAVWQWLPGRLLRTAMPLAEFDPRDLLHTGAALAEFHRLPVSGGLDATASGVLRMAQVRSAALALESLHRDLRSPARELLARVLSGLAAGGPLSGRVHGDFYDKQVVVATDRIGFIDLDSVRRGEPEEDLANFVAHLVRGVVSRRLPEGQLPGWQEALLRGYREGGGRLDERRLRLLTAANLLRVASHPFRNREKDWLDQTLRLVERAKAVLGSGGDRSPVSRPPSRRPPSRWSPAQGPSEALRRRLTELRRDSVTRGTESVERIDLVDSRILVTVSTGEGLGWRLLDEEGVRPIDPRSDPDLPMANHLNGSLVLAYRPFRRLCVRRTQDPPGVVEKGYRRGRSARAVMLYSVAAAAARSGSFRVLPVLEHRSGRESLEFEAVLGSRLEVRPEAAARFRGVGQCLRAFQDVEPHPGLPTFDHRDELAVLARWADRVVRLTGSLPPGWAEVSDRLQVAAGSLGPMQTVLAHRDFHDGQLLDVGRDIVLLDFDLLCAGDVALDAANLLSHFELRALQGAAGADPSGARACAREFERGLGRKQTADFRQRLFFYRATSLLRLALVYRLRPPWAALSQPLTRRAGEVAGGLGT